MPNSLQSSAIASPASRRATNCSLSSITEHSFQGITPSPLRGESVTYVSGTMCYLCLRSLTLSLNDLRICRASVLHEICSARSANYVRGRLSLRKIEVESHFVSPLLSVLYVFD